MSTPHPRTLRRNIWAGLLVATDQEIRDGMDFYPGAHGLCRLFARMFETTPGHVAGIYAALSPMNGWYTNVANVLSVLRHNQWLQELSVDNWPTVAISRHEDFKPDVNTSNANRDKALAIAAGSCPSAILRGRKVTAFWRAIADPDDRAPILVDRHLINLALGSKVTGNIELRSLAGSHALYSAIESAYADLGRRENLGNRLASIAWFVQRRISAAQVPMFHDSAPVCCGLPMWSHGHKPRRFYCGRCRRSTTRRPDARPPLFYLDGRPVRADYRGRKRIHLGVGHEYANSGGWQYLGRYLIARDLGRRLRTDEHCHHQNLDRRDDRRENWELLAAEYHGRTHGLASVVARPRGADGRFVEVDRSDGHYFPWWRSGPILGPAAREET